MMIDMWREDLKVRLDYAEEIGRLRGSIQVALYDAALPDRVREQLARNLRESRDRLGF